MVNFFPLALLPPPSPGCGLPHGGVQVQDTTGILEEVSWTLTAGACGWVGGQRQREEDMKTWEEVVHLKPKREAWNRSFLHDSWEESALLIP